MKRQQPNSCNRSRIVSRKRRASSSMLETDNEVVGIAHDGHVARGLLAKVASAPAKDQGRSTGRRWQTSGEITAALPRPPLTDHVTTPSSRMPHLGPFPDQARINPSGRRSDIPGSEPAIAGAVLNRRVIGPSASSIQFTFCCSRSRQRAHPVRGALPRKQARNPYENQRKSAS